MIKPIPQPSRKGEEPKTIKRPAKKKDVERFTRDMKQGSYRTR